LNLLANVLARQDAADKGCAEAILVDEHGRITEGAGSTFFGILDGTLSTAPLTANILPSITRQFVIRAAQNVGMSVKEECLTPQQAVSADELFIAVTTKDIVPVVQFDRLPIKDSKPGPQTKALRQEFLKFTR
jgi:D-alanine transaminase